MARVDLRKKCFKCKKKKNTEAFYRIRKSRNDRHHLCLECKDLHGDIPAPKQKSYAWEKYNKSNKGKRTKKAWFLKSHYGLDIDPEDIPDECQTCNNKCSTGKALSVDHWHTTNRFRGFLCRKCNVALGLVGDNKETLKKMIKYLEVP